MMKKIFTRFLAVLALLVFMTPSLAGWGQTRADLVLTFPLTSNPGGWPTSNPTTLTNYTYTLNNVNYTFALKNVKQNSGYLMMTSVAALGLPAIENYKLTKVVASNSSGCSTSTRVGISSSASSASYIDGGAYQTWSTQSFSYTYNLTSTEANTMYYMYVTNKNAQVTSLELTYEETGGGGDTPATYTVTYDANGGTGTMTDSNSPYEAEAEVTLLDNTFEAPEGKMWGSWSVKDADDHDVTITEGKFIMPTSDVTVTAQWIIDPSAPQYEWVLTSLDALTSSDIFVIVGNNEYAMTNDKGSNRPTSVAVTVSSSKITSTVSDNIKWNVSGNSTDGYTFYPNGVTTIWLNSPSSSTYLQVTNAASNKSFTLNDNHLYSSGSGRYAIRYSDGTWRAYTSTSGYETNITFYKRQEVSNVATPTFSVAAGTYYEAKNVELACETSGATIYYTTNGDTPTSSSTPYTSPIAVNATTTIKAIAVLGNESSSVASATYTIVPMSNISAITTSGDPYMIQGTVVAKNERSIVIGDNTGYVNYYNGNSAPSVSVNDMVIIKGVTDTHGNAIQFTSSASIETATSSNYNGAPAVNIITAIPNYTSGLHLSDYFQFEGTLTKSSTYYYVSCGEGNINIAYPSDAQQTSMNALENKTVRVKGYFGGINSSDYFTVILESIEEVVNPSIEATPSPFTAPSYVVGTAEPEFETLTVNGSNLTANISLSLGDNSNFEMLTDLNTWNSSLTLTQTDGSVTNADVAIRLKVGLAKGSYEGTLTLSTEGASNVEVALNGSVTGQTYAINIDNEITGGTIEADLTTAEEGATVTLTATPDAAYNFSAWMVLKDDQTTEVTVTNNQFTMPACQVYVTAEFTAKPTNAITCVISPLGAAEMVTDATNDLAYEGQFVTLTIDNIQAGYNLSSIVITKAEDGSATGITPTASGDDYTFTMPGYAVTATATFISETYNGSFVKFTGDAMEEGDYILVYNGKAVKNTVNNSKLESVAVDETNAIITDPSRTIVWHIDESSTENYWTIYNASEAKYIFATYNKTNVSMVSSLTGANSGAFWSVTKTDDTYDFRCKGNIDASGTIRYLRINADGNVFGNYASDNTNGPLTLYKYTELTERTITFNGNGGETENEETTYTQTVYDGIAANLTTNQFSKGDLAFIGWSTTQNGVVEYADGASITVSGDIILYAQWSTAYTAMVDDEIVGGTVLINDEEIVEVAAGTVMTLTYNATPGYAFSAWNVYKANNPTETVEVENNQFNMPEYDVFVSAKFDEVTTYSLVTDVDQIVSGKHYIIATGSINNKYYAIGGQNSSGYRNPVEVTVDNNYIAHTDGLYEFVLNDNESGWTIYDKITSGYFVSGNKSLTTNANNGTVFNISINDNVNDPKATISNGGYSIQYNSSSPRFACYSSSQKDVYLYIKLNDNDLEYYGSEIAYAGTSIPADETITIGTGSVMTVPAGFTNDDPANLIIEDGGQLISNNAVQATIRRSITGYSSKGDNNGWYFIATPVAEGTTPSVDNGVLAGSYDLYYYNEPTHYWFNYKSHDGNEDPGFTLLNGKGYLYANTVDADLSFEGATVSANAEVEILLSYTTSLTPEGLKGFNLVGNPFTYNLTGTSSITLGGGGFNTYYRIEDGVGITSTTIGESPIQPGVGFMVQATGTGQKLVFNPSAKGRAVTKPSYIRIMAGNDSFMDHAYIQFGNFNTLRKYVLNDETPQVYVMNEGLDWAATILDEPVGEMPVNFKAGKNGTYTINVEPENVEVSYLHLIDNLTSANVDLLANPSYTFEASTNDYASRFRLVFSANNGTNEDANETFAYFNGSEWVINGTGNATLQVIDVMGRVLRSEQINGNTAINLNQAAGIYMLRLINGENVMVQKVVVR